MTINQLFRELQKLKLDGCGEYGVMISDFTWKKNPVPQPIGSVKILKNVKKVFLQSIDVEEKIAKAKKE